MTQFTRRKAKTAVNKTLLTSTTSTFAHCLYTDDTVTSSRDVALAQHDGMVVEKDTICDATATRCNAIAT